MEITPTEERVRLRIRNDRCPYLHQGTLDTITRWLERMARRKGRHISEPSVVVETDYIPEYRKTFLYAWADSFPDTLPDWLRTARPTNEGVIHLSDINEVEGQGKGENY